MVKDAVIDFGTYQQAEMKTSDVIVKYFDENLAGANKALQNASPRDMNELVKRRGRFRYL